MRPIWKGSISFGLVTIPVSVLNAIKREELKFRMLREGDLSPIQYKRVAEVDQKEVPWEKIVKGFEYEKEKFVVLKEQDFDKAELQGTDSIAIQDFVDLKEINPIQFYKPYYLEPGKGGAPAYGLLRDVLKETGKVGIARVVLRNRQHLAAVKANGNILVLELMHFASEIVPADSVKAPAKHTAGARELKMAQALVDQMSSKWDPEKYTDEYSAAMMKVIEKKIELGGKELPGVKRHAPAATNVVDLMEVLRESLSKAGGGGAPTAKRVGRRTPPKTGTRKRTPKRTAHKHAA